MFTPSTIKAIQDIMRQDIGVDGDATRLSQMVWLIFLKILDDEDKALEIRKEKFVPTLPKKYQWRTWAGPLDGMTGDKLIGFVNNDLLPGLRDLPESSNKRTDLTRMAFQDVYNFMRKGTLLKQVINKIDEIDFNASKDRHAFNEIYERLLKSLQSAGNFGEMYTPRAVTQFIVEMVDPQVGEAVLDPAVGTGGFLVHALEHMRKQVKSVKDEQKIQQSIHGVEKKPLPFMLLITNMMLHGIEEPVTMRRGNTLERPLREYTDADKVNCIVTNPPFGGTEEPGIESNFPKEFQTRETADLFLVLIMRLLKKNGRAGLVLPDGSLSGEGVKIAIKKQLFEECNLHTIVRLPKGVFSPYTGIPTNLLFFTKGEPTKEVWYYEHVYPEGQKSYSMTSPILIEEFEAERAWWSNRVENPHAWKISIDEIKSNGYNLDIKNPNTAEELAKSPEELLAEHYKRRDTIKEIADEIRNSINESFTHTKISGHLKTIVDNLVDFVEIPYGIHRLEREVLRQALSGQLIAQNKKDGNAKDLYKRIQDNRKQAGPKLRSKPLLPLNEAPLVIPASWLWVRLGEVCDFIYGDGLDREKRKSDGKYPAYGANGELARSDLFNCESDGIIIGRKGSAGAVTIAKGPFYALDVTYFIPRGQYGAFDLNYLATLLSFLDLPKLASGIKPGLNRNDAYRIPIALPPIAEQKRIVEKVEEVSALIQKLRLSME